MTIEHRIAVVTDGHYGRSQEDNDNHDTALTLIDDIHADRSIDVLVYNGDIVHDDEVLHNTVITEFFDQLPSGVDWYPVFGNHDWATDSEWETYYGHSKNHTFEIGDYGCLLVETGQSRDAESAGNYSGADATWIETQIDGFSSKEGVLAFHHIAPFTDTDHYGVDQPAVRTQYEREEVAAVFLGHNHGKNFVEDKNGARYIYTCRMGGGDLANSNYSIEDFGVRVFDITQ